MTQSTLSFRSVCKAVRRLLVFSIYSVAFSSLLTFCRVAFFFCYSDVRDYLVNARFYPINGTFQAYNPIRRLLDGQFPGLDFVSYTGLGPSLLTLSAMLVSGCQSYVCSVFWGNLLPRLLHILFFSWISFLCLVGGRVPLARWFQVFLAIVLGFVIGLPVPTKYPLLDSYLTYSYPLDSLGNSQLGLRAAGATICSIFIFIIASCTSSRLRSAFTTVAFCVALTWSNDYGLFSALSVVATYVLVESRYNGLSLTTWKRFGSTLLRSIAAYVVLITSVSGGHPLLWLSRNVLGVAQDQMWYFVPHAKVLTLGDAIALLRSVSHLYPSFALVLIVVLWRPRIPALYASASLVFIPLCSGVLSQIGGHVSEHYMIAFERAFWPAIAVWVVCLTRLAFLRFMPSSVFGSLFLLIGGIVVGVIALGVDDSRILAVEGREFGKRDVWFSPTIAPALFVFALLLAHGVLEKLMSRKFAQVFVTVFLIGYVGLARRADGSNLLTPPGFKGEVAAVQASCIRRAQTYVPALGGCLDTDRAESLSHLAARATNSSDVFSTYSSAFDVMVGAFNSSGSDYIIHALGDIWRKRYETILEQAKHEYVTTIRGDFTHWESWARRTNWGAYRAILAHYRIVGATDYNLLWKRSAVVERDLPPGGCEVIKQSPMTTALKVTPPSDLREPGYVDIELEYQVEQSPWWSSPFTIRPYVTVHDNWGHSEGSFGIPSKAGSHAWRFPVEFTAHEFATSESPHRVIFIQSAPQGSAVNVLKCSSKFSVRASRFLPTPEMR